jgi:two-component system response regulator HydG
MPGMDGVEVCRRIVADYPELPVVVLTARDDVEVEMTCREAGAAAFMTKPLLSGQLTDVLTSVLRA